MNNVGKLLVFFMCLLVGSAYAIDTVTMDIVDLQKIKKSIQEGQYSNQTFSQQTKVNIGESAAATEVEYYSIKIDTSDLLNEPLTKLSISKEGDYFFANKSRKRTMSGRWLLSGELVYYNSEMKTVKAAGAVRFIVNKHMVSGEVNIDGVSYQFTPNRKGNILLRIASLSSFPDSADPNVAVRFMSHASAQNNRGISSAKAETTPDGKHIIDVLFLFDQSAVEKNEDPAGKAELFVAQANAVLENSKINMKIRIAGSVNVNFHKTLDPYVDLDNLSYFDGLVLEEIHAYRDVVGADLVSLVVDGNDYSVCGLARVNTNFENAFSIVRQDCPEQLYVFIHEAAHNLGAHHNPESFDPGKSNTYYPYGHGLQKPDLKWRTIMSYECHDSSFFCPIHPYFSNSLMTDPEGVALGTMDQHDNARVLNERTPIVSAYNALPESDCGVTASLEEQVMGGRVNRTTSRFFNITRYYTVGSNEYLGSDGKITVSLKETVPGTFISVSCESTSPILEQITWERGQNEVKISGMVLAQGAPVASVLVTGDMHSGQPTLCQVAPGSIEFQCNVHNLENREYEFEVLGVSIRGDKGNPVTLSVSAEENTDPETPFDIINVTSDVIGSNVSITGQLLGGKDTGVSLFVYLNKTWTGECPLTEGRFVCDLEGVEEGEYSYALAVLDFSGIEKSRYFGKFTITSIEPDCVGFTNALSEHVEQGRAQRQGRYFFTRFYATGTGEYLGSTSTSVVSLIESAPGVFQAGSCEESRVE